jgi:hypothetical protein
MNGQVNRSRVGKPEADAQRVADERNAPDCARLSGRGHGGEAGSPASPLRDRAPAKPAEGRGEPPPVGSILVPRTQLCDLRESDEMSFPGDDSLLS